MPNSTLIIFDLDGTLVDSEVLNSQAIVDLNPEIPDSAETLSARYHGMRLATIMEDLERRYGLSLPEDYIQRYRNTLQRLFGQGLNPVSGVPDMLKRLPHPRCVASSAASSKIQQALKLTGLDGFFEDNTFSSYDIGSWKPEPGIFLHAAEKMQHRVEDCIVIEDSIHGVNAARSAGIFVFHYTEVAAIEDDSSYQQFSDMGDLIALINRRVENKC
ncbi:MAG: 6-phosphogluconate phosphatase [Pseudohongiella sp.]|nr:MAG: 6-phosphogluconate phosphatase [Pseudohongiella sp.]